jgi:hypothetical protein
MGETQNKDRAVFKMLWPDKKVIMSHKGTTGKGYGTSIKLSEHSLENPDLCAWEGFGLMWERAQDMEWWQKFINWLWEVHGDHSWVQHNSPHIIEWEHIHPTRFRDALYDYGVEAGLILGEAL